MIDQPAGIATRVTVLDDDADILDLFRELFEARGFEVDTHAGALPGIEVLIASKPDLIVVDLRLAPQREELTGLQVIHSARSSAALRDTPIIVVSADLPELSEAWPDLMERGDVQMLQKPFDLVAFERVVETALGLGHGDSAPRSTRATNSGMIDAGTDRDDG